MGAVDKVPRYKAVVVEKVSSIAFRQCGLKANKITQKIPVLSVSPTSLRGRAVSYTTAGEGEKDAHLEGRVGDGVVAADDDDALAAGEEVADGRRDLVDSL